MSHCKPLFFLRTSKCNKKFNIHCTNSNFINVACVALNMPGPSRYFFAVPQLFTMWRY